MPARRGAARSARLAAGVIFRNGLYTADIDTPLTRVCADDEETHRPGWLEVKVIICVRVDWQRRVRLAATTTRRARASSLPLPIHSRSVVCSLARITVFLAGA